MIKLLHILTMLIFVSCFMIGNFFWKPSGVTYPHLKKSIAYLMGLLLLSVVLGVFLVDEKGYFLTTPWIQVALLGSLILFFLLAAIFYLWRKRLFSGELSRLDKIALCMLQLLSFSILVIIMHDAVTKTTIL